MRRRSGLSVVATALVALATQECMVVTNASDYQVGPHAALSGCTSTSQCATGFVCLLDLCVHTCAKSDDCDPNWACIPDGMGDQVCEPHCNPLSGQVPDATHVACQAGAACLINHQVTFCGGGGPGSVAEGDPCTVYADCVAGLVCSGDTTGTAGVCARFCRVNQSDCSSPTTCQSFTPPETDGTQEIGLCLK